MARPNVTVFNTSGQAAGNIALPEVFTAPIRHDIVRFVHTNIAKNARQPYAVARQVGHRATAESWGTGRAVSRIPRVGGGGTNRSGAGAYGNMCTGGRMFAPTKVFRRWNRRVNKNVRRYAVASAVAASALPPLVAARGHVIDKVPELPLVVSDAIQGLQKTKEAVALLQALKAFMDVEKAKETKIKRPGVGKTRNRRYITRKGPLVVLNKNEGGWKAFRNLPGVDLAFVNSLNLLQLAPGGHLGRFIIWSEAAFNALNAVFGNKGPATTRTYRLPASAVTNTDVTGIMNSNEVQSVLRAKKRNTQKRRVEHNPLRNKTIQSKLMPYSKFVRAQVKSALRKQAQKGGAAPAKTQPKTQAKPQGKPAAKAQGKK